MKAHSAGGCWLCGSVWAPGDAISRWLGDWVHEACKAARQASVASEGHRTVLPPVLPEPEVHVIQPHGNPRYRASLLM